MVLDGKHLRVFTEQRGGQHAANGCSYRRYRLAQGELQRGQRRVRGGSLDRGLRQGPGHRRPFRSLGHLPGQCLAGFPRRRENAALTLRRAGSPWRILVHEWLGRSGPTLYGRQFHAGNDPSAPARGAERIRRLNELRPDLEPTADTTGYTVLEGTEFDEIVVGHWLHAEQQDAGQWWISIGGVVVLVAADRDGRPNELNWTAPDEG
jgi:hypothetical protein